jgi:hypothetical protein
MSNGKKISQLENGGSIEQQDYLPVARGSDETYKIAAKQFVVNAITQGLGMPIVIGKQDGAGQTLLFRSLSGVDGISIVNIGNTTVVSGSGQNPIKTSIIGNNINTTYAINGAQSINANNYRVDIDGVLQEPLTDYNIVGSNIVFTSAPPLSGKVTVVSNNLVRAYDIIPSDGSVNSNKIVSQAVITDKLALSSVTTDIISNNAVTSAKVADGAVVQVVNMTNTEIKTIGEPYGIAINNSLPVRSQGLELFSATIERKSTTNKILIQAQVFGANPATTGTAAPVVVLFRNSETTPLSMGSVGLAPSYGGWSFIRFFDSPSGAATVTYTIVGYYGAGNFGWYLNANVNGTPIFGGALQSSMTLTEVKA